MADKTTQVSSQPESLLLQELKLQTITHLASGIAHDVNNLLTVIPTCSALLRDQGVDATSRELLHDMQQANERASTLIRQLLNFCRNQLLQPQVLDLNVLITNLLPLMRRLLGADVDLLTHLGQGPFLVKVDPGQMEQVLLNLTVNARDAMPGGGTLTVATAAVHLEAAAHSGGSSFRPGAYLQLTLGDTGCGMDEYVRARIFEPFFTTKHPSRGTGVGLATVDRIVRLSGGLIEVQSEKGKGTTFTIYLPAVLSATTPALPPLLSAYAR